MILSAPSIKSADGAAQENATAIRWFVLHTKSRQEKAVAELLEQFRAEHFLPLTRHTRTYGRRKVHAELPLFPGYVFLKGTIEQAYAVDRLDRIVQIIRVADQTHLEWELRNIQAALEQQTPLDPYPYLKEGILVEVRSGPLLGLQGMVESRSRMDRLILKVDLLGRAVSMEIDSKILQPV